MPESHVSWSGGVGEPLLKTKLFVPRARYGTVVRPRLFALVDQGLSRKLTLISAPAGSGKTTLLSEWCQTETGRATPVAWVSLEGADDHPHRFWRYLVQALDSLLDGGLDEVIQTLSLPQPGPPEPVVRRLINHLAGMEQDSVLVLDDYHVIGTEEIHRSVALLLEYMPPQLHLVVASRVDPPLPLARLRVRREMVEVRLEELRFTQSETAAFFGGMMGLQLTDRQITLLAGRTEGWVAGLQLAGLSLEGLADVDRFVEAFAGSHQYILDYLVEEVLQLQTEQVQRFLLQTAVLDRLSGPLCDAVTGENDGQAVLEWLEKRNLFVVALDHQRQWYRYHHLFAEALRERLIRERPAEEVRQLHRAASLWYEEQGWTEPAVDHALAAAEYDRAVHMMTAAAEKIWHRGDSGILMGWLERLPDGLVRSRPELSFSIAWACMTSGRPDLAESFLQSAEGALAGRGPEEHRLLGRILATRAQTARIELRLSASVENSLRALDLLPVTDLDWRGWAVLSLGAVRQWEGNLSEALERYSEARRLFREAGDLYGFLRATVWYAEVLAVAGRLPEALAEAEAALILAEAQVGASEPVISLAHLGVGEMLYERFDLDGAEQHLLRSLELSRAGGLLDVVWLAYLPLALVKQGKGENGAALACLDAADQLAPRVPWAIAMSAVVRARLLQRQGSPGPAARLMPQVESLAREEVTPYHRSAWTLAAWKLGHGFGEEALALLEGGAGRVEGDSVRFLALRALAHGACGQTERALAVLERALVVAVPSGSVAPFMELDQPMAGLLALGAARWRGPVADFTGQVLERVGVSRTTAPRSPRPMQSELAVRLVEPPSERELEVLALLAEGASNEMIAQLR